MVTVVVPFGGGVNSRSFSQDINEQDCSSGENFTLDPSDRKYKNRKPFDLVATAPNAGSINGFITLLQSDGTVGFLVQAGTTVYDWDGTSFTSKGTVSASAKLRGRKEHNWQLSDKVLITDLALVEPVMEYDGTTLADVSFLSNPSTAWVGDFRARYLTIVDERAIFANIYDNATAFPHFIVGTKRSDYQTLSVSDRPSTSLADDDPFYLVQPDLRYINGMVEAFGVVALSSRKGPIWKLTGSSAQDFAMEALHSDSGASGDESVVFIGNDVFYGREGRIESLINTDKYGDVDVDDISARIFDQIQEYTAWTNVYNSRNQRVYCFPTGQSECWVFFKSLAATELSPWSKWTTQDSLAFAPTTVMNMYDPTDGLEYVFMGDSSGNIYRMEGTGTGDNGSSIITTRKSRLFKVEGVSNISQVSGYIEYIANEEVDITIRLLFQGREVLTQQVTLTLPAISSGAVYGGAYYYGNGSIYGTLTGSIKRQEILIPGEGDMFQVEVEANTTADFEIVEIGLDFETR